MKITIAVANAKGGSGKTTTAMLVAANLASETFSVAVVDLDPQASSYMWSAAGQGLFPAEVVHATAETLAAVLAGLDVDAVLLDCPPSATAPETLAAIDVADLLVIPCGCSPLDYWATDAMHIAAEIRRPELQRLVVVTQSLHTKLSVELAGHIRTTWPTARAQLASRTVYREAGVAGLGLRQMPGRTNHDAANELDALSVEILTNAIRSK